jgi:hypothetical protein
MTEREVKKPTVRPILRTRGDEGFRIIIIRMMCSRLLL